MPAPDAVFAGLRGSFAKGDTESLKIRQTRRLVSPKVSPKYAKVYRVSSLRAAIRFTEAARAIALSLHCLDVLGLQPKGGYQESQHFANKGVSLAKSIP